MVNGFFQWLMPVRHRASPFWVQAVKRNMYIGFVCNFTFLPHLAAMVPNLCIDKKLGCDSPRCVVSFPRIGIGQMDSKQEFFAPSDVQVNLQCAMLISSAAYTHNMPKVAVQLFVRRFGPIVPVMQNFMPFEGPVGV